MPKGLHVLKDTLTRVHQTALKFKNPSFSYYFAEKAQEQLRLVEKEGQQLTPESIASKQAEYSELLEVLERQTVIHNYYFDKGVRAEK